MSLGQLFALASPNEESASGLAGLSVILSVILMGFLIMYDQETCKGYCCIDCLWIHSFIHGNLTFTFHHTGTMQCLVTGNGHIG
jgi:hypothetical protein